MRQLMVLPALLIGISFSSHAQTIMAGSEIDVRAASPITVGEYDVGTNFTGYVTNNVLDTNGNVAIPRGTQAEFVVRQAGYNQLSLDVDAVMLNGSRYPLKTAGVMFNIPRDEYDSGTALSQVMSSVSAAPGSTVYVQVVGDELQIPSGAVVHSHLAQQTELMTSPTYYSYPQPGNGSYR